MKYYKATDSRGNEWATSRKNPDQVVRYFTLTAWGPFVSWTANPSTKDDITEVQTNIVEIDAKEYRQIMKNRELFICMHTDATEKIRAKYNKFDCETEEAEGPTEDSDTSWIEDLAEAQFSQEKITLRLTLEQLSKLTIQQDVTYGASKYDPIVSEGVMDMLREKRIEVEAKQIALRDFCEVASEQLGTDNVADVKKLLKNPANKKILNDFVRMYKDQLAAN
tara:strand:+ start:137 stop:802 length:666 start_codon:yes stop_codon:yes gene_type:complete